MLQYLSRKGLVTVLGQDKLIGEYEGEQYWRVKTDSDEWSVRESLLLNGLTTCPQPPLGRATARMALDKTTWTHQR